jgi:hypothetical protein
MFHIPCSMFHVPCSMFHVPCSMFWKPSRRGENSMHNTIILYKWYLGRNLRLEAANRWNTAEQVVDAFW